MFYMAPARRLSLDEDVLSGCPGTPVAVCEGDSRRESHMAHSPRLSRTFVAVIALLSSVTAARAKAADPIRVTSVANATVRSAPSADAPAVAQVPLGTELPESGPAGLDKTWVLVRLDDAREGWLQTRLTKPLDPTWRTEAYDAIIAERLARKGDGFSASIELVSFIERVSAAYGDRTSRAQVDLARLQALSRAAAAVSVSAARREPYAAWLASRAKELVYDEPGGRWLVSQTAIWDAHGRNRDTPAADDIAWFAVSTGLAGECEGHVACYVAAANLLHGAYLRAHPFGRHVNDAVDAVNDLVSTIMPSGRLSRTYAFTRTEDCQELLRGVDGLSGALQVTKAARSQSTLDALASLRQLCQ
jgi:hypothetical protein